MSDRTLEEFWSYLQKNNGTWGDIEEQVSICSNLSTSWLWSCPWMFHRPPNQRGNTICKSILVNSLSTEKMEDSRDAGNRGSGNTLLIIPVPRRLRQQDHKYKSTLYYIVSSRLGEGRRKGQNLKISEVTKLEKEQMNRNTTRIPSFMKEVAHASQHEHLSNCAKHMNQTLPDLRTLSLYICVSQQTILQTYRKCT